MENPLQQSVPQLNQIEDNKTSVPKTGAKISSPIGNSLNGGHNKTIHWQYVMAGQHLQKGVLSLNIQMLTPKTPAYQKLTAKVMLVYVPHERVFKNYLDYIGQRGGNTVAKIKEKPNFKGKIISKAFTQTKETSIMNTTLWRDHWIASYINRMYTYEEANTGDMPELNFIMPSYDALPVRAFIAAFNDVIRNKEYEKPLEEFTEMNTVSDYEWNTYMPSFNNGIEIDVQQMRCRRNTSYYTNYRTEMQGLDLVAPEVEDYANSGQALLQWASWEQKIDLARENAQNAQMRDIDILAKIRGSKKLSESRVQTLAVKTFNLNYSAITQTAYNANETIEDKFKVLGQQGGYSYTNVQLPIGEDIMFLSDGTIHLIMCVTADTVFETAINRRRRTIYAIDEYRPELQDDKLDVIYRNEYGTTIPQVSTPASENQIIGYKRKYNEYFCGNTVIGGDMSGLNYYEVDEGVGGSVTLTESIVETNKTYQFFEVDGEFDIIYTENGFDYTLKKIWYDYTDLQINKNQAIMNPVKVWNTLPNEYYGSHSVLGNNQIFLVGEYTIVTTLPIASQVKDNFSDWGEH